MDDKQFKFIKSYRIVWRLNLVDRHEHPYTYQSSSLKINNTDLCLKMNIKGHMQTEYEFILCKQDNIDVRRCSFYLLSENPPKCITLGSPYEKYTMFETRPTPFIHSANDMTLVCSFSVFEYGKRNIAPRKLSWLETKTQEINNTIDMQSYAFEEEAHVYTLDINKIRNRTLKAELSKCAKGMLVKLRTIGLDKGQHVQVAIYNSYLLEDSEKEPAVFCVGPTTIEHVSNTTMESFVDVFAILDEFQEMSEVRISQIVELLKTSDDHGRKDNSQALQEILSVEENRTPTSITSKKTDNIASPPTTDAVEVISATSKQLTMLHCLTDNMFCDITMQVAGGHNIPAHKVILVSGSTVWRQLLTNDRQIAIINIPDLEKDVIEALVTFIYIGSVPEPPRNIDQLLIAAEKYGVDGLKKWCEQKIKV